MREIRTSGSMRGEWVVLLTDIAHSPTLPRNLSITFLRTWRLMSRKDAKIRKGRLKAALRTSFIDLPIRR